MLARRNTHSSRQHIAAGGQLADPRIWCSIGDFFMFVIPVSFPSNDEQLVRRMNHATNNALGYRLDESFLWAVLLLPLCCELPWGHAKIITDPLTGFDAASLAELFRVALNATEVVVLATDSFSRNESSAMSSLVEPHTTA